MELFEKKLENYQKNLRCIQEVTDELLRHMKGYDWSFRKEITDKKGAYSQERLHALVEDLLALWTAKLEEHADTDPATGKSVVEPWLQERRELYGLYLYLVMRCSLEKGGYRDARNGAELVERTDFAFLLEQARRLSQKWCVVTGPDNTRRNELYEGYDAHFGLHLYYALNDPDVRRGYIYRGNDYSLTPDWRQVWTHEGDLTNDGNMKRIYLQHSSRFWFRQAEAREETEAEEEAPDGETEELALPEGEDDDFVEAGYDLAEDDDDWYPFPDEESYREFQAADWDRRSEEFEREQGLILLAIGFECQGEYCSACERFVELFQNARPEVLRDFYANLEEIVDLYLAQREIAPLSDTNKAMNVYSRVYDGALQQARRYGRGIQWEAL